MEKNIGHSNHNDVKWKNRTESARERKDDIIGESGQTRELGC